MKNKLFTLFILVILCLSLVQCLHPTKGQFNIYYDDNVQLIDDWSTIDAVWQFKDNNELTIYTESEKIEGLWIAEETTLEIITGNESTLYQVNVINENKLKLTYGEKEIILKK